MKTTINNLITLTLVALIITSCGNSGGNKDNAAKDSSQSVTDTSAKKEEKPELEPANVTCKIYFKSDDITEEEGYADSGPTVTKGEVGERTSFRTNKSYTYCYDSEGFHHLSLSGKGEQLTLVVKSDAGTTFKKENFDLDGNISFSNRNFTFEMGQTYSIVLTQGETVIFRGKIDSQGCM